MTSPNTTPNTIRKAQARAKRISIREAAQLAYAQGLMGADYHALSSDDLYLLRDLRNKTKWRETAKQVARGGSELRSFYQSLERYVPKPTALSKGKKERAEAMEARGTKYWSKATHTTYGEVIDKRHERGVLKSANAGDDKPIEVY